MEIIIMYCRINIIMVSILTVHAVSWLNKDDHRSYQVTSLMTSKGSVELEEEQCKDRRTNCKSLADKCNLVIIKKLCKDTCGGCRAELPIDCSITKHGCCWDGATIAKGPNDKGCQPCVDKFSLCKHFKNQCSEHRMKMICPVTCGVQCQQCEDNPHQALICPMYKEFGFCELSRDLMQNICSKTCGFCP